MRYQLSLVITFLFLITTVAVVDAREEQSRAFQTETKQRLELGVENKRPENKSDRPIETKERVETRQENRPELRNNTTTNHAERLGKRFTFYSTRLSVLRLKIEARLDAMEATGKNVAAARIKLSEAVEALAQAQVLADKAISIFESITPENLAEHRDEARTARDLALQARKQYLVAVGAMKEAVRLAKSVE